jgi:hypothetical protein
MGQRVYATDAAMRRLALRDELPEADDPRADWVEMRQRIETVEQALEVLIMRQADGSAGTTCTNECPVDNPDEDEPRNAEILKAQHVPGSMGDVFDELPSAASINARNAEFWSTPKATPTVSVMGNPGPAPGNENSGKGQNFMPGAARSIDNPRRLSTIAKSLDVGKTGSWSTDGVPNANFYRALDAKTNSVISKMNAANARAYGRR